MSRAIFISKNEQEIKQLVAFAETHKFQLIAHSFLHFERVESERPERFDCLFFGSPRSVIFYLSQSAIPNGIKIACSGEKTGELLRDLGYTPNFIAEKSGEISKASLDFANWCGSSKVLFPLSETSHKSYIKHLDPSQVFEMVVYRTQIVRKKITPSEIYIFTSPSNVKGFFLENDLPTSATTIAWGETTASALKGCGVSVNHVLDQSSEGELVAYLERL